MNFKRVTKGLCVAPVLAALDAHPELWSQITVRQDFPGSAHHDTECIFLRGPAAFTPEDYFGDATAHDYPALDVLREAVEPLLPPLLKAMGVVELGYVLVVKLLPGGRIDEHIDEGAYADHYQRFHIALSGEEGATLTVGGETQHFAPGEIWWFNHKALHSGHNDSQAERVHIIFDAVVRLPQEMVETLPPMLTIRESTVDEMMAHAGALFAAHWDEIALNKQVMVLKPDEAKYRAMAEQGMLLILAAFEGEALIGYSVNFVIPHLHYADLRVCSNDLLFLAKGHRGGGAGLKLMQMTETMAQERGARLMTWHAKPNTPLNDILPRLGYGVQDVMYSKEL